MYGHTTKFLNNMIVHLELYLQVQKYTVAICSFVAKWFYV